VSEPPPTTHKKTEEQFVQVGHAIKDRPNYFRVVYAFFTVTSLLLGPSRLLNGSLFIMWFQWPLLCVCAVTGMVHYVFLLPDYYKTCCLKPGVRRSDLGSCADVNSLIYKEIVGISSVKQECGSSSVALVAVYSTFILSLCLILLIHFAQVEEVLRLYRKGFAVFHGSLHPQTSHIKGLDQTADAAIFAVDLVALHDKSRDKGLSLYFWPESFLFAGPIIMFHGWWWCILHTVLTLIAAFSTAYYFEIVRRLWLAWGCYVPGTPIDDLNNGLCNGGLYKQDVKSYVSLFIGCGTFVLKVFLYYLGYVTTKKKRTEYRSHIEKQSLVTDQDKQVLLSYVDSAIPHTG
jgi:hypothetical protein